MVTPTLPPRFRVLGVAGAGASATVFHVEDTELGVERALKVLRDPSPEARARFEREARTLARVRHAHLLVLYDRLELPEGPALVLEWCPGSLVARVQSGGPLPPAEVARLGADAAGALAALHAVGAVHRDIAPANLLVAADGSVRVADLGVMTERAGVTVTPAGSVLGTLTTMAPEQRGGSQLAVPASDVYALSVTLAWAALGEYPGELYVDTVAARLRRALPGALAEVLLAAGAWEIDARPSAAGFAERLAAVELRLGDGGAGEHAPGPRTGAGPPLHHKTSRTWREHAAGLVAAWIVVLVAAAAVFTLRPIPRPSVFDRLHAAPICDATLAPRLDRVATAPRETMAAALRDLDADGRDDVVLVGQLDEVVQVRRGNAAASLDEVTTLPTGRVSGRPAVGDLDGDGRLDLVVAMPDSSELAVLLSEPSGGFALRRVMQPTVPRAVALVPWNDDATLDAMVLLNDGRLVLRPGRGDGTFGPAVFIAEGVSFVMEVRREGVPHLALARRGTGLALQVPDSLLAPVAGAMLLPADTFATLVAASITSADVDHDGEDSLYAVLPASAATVLRWDAGAQEPCALVPGFVNFGGNIPVALGDFNGDGLEDIASVDTCAYCAGQVGISLLRRDAPPVEGASRSTGAPGQGSP